VVQQSEPSAKIYLYRSRARLEFEIGEVISPMVYSEKEWESNYRITPFYSNVMREGQLL